MSDLNKHSSYEILVALFECLSEAIETTRAAASRPWEAGEIAARWLEHEVSPLLEAFRTKGPALWIAPGHDQVLSMRSPSPVLPGQTITLGSQGVHYSLQPRYLHIGDDPQDWIIDDIKIGGRSQGSVLGFDVVRPYMNVEICVRYVGDAPAGKQFYAVLHGVRVIGEVPDD